MVIINVVGSCFCNIKDLLKAITNTYKIIKITPKTSIDLVMDALAIDSDLKCISFSDDDLDQLVHFITANYKTNYIIDWTAPSLSFVAFASFKKARPFFCTMLIESPPLLHYESYITTKKKSTLDLKEFLQWHHQQYFYQKESKFSFDVRLIDDGSQCIISQFSAINFAELVRPPWTHYFMQLAILSAKRSNCMKRKVGAIIEKGYRIIATGYNGTPTGTTNCNDGGCSRCNDATIKGGERLNECFCIHAEENALLESGRNAFNATMYCSTCPCVGCAKKIVQVGIKKVVYSEAFHMDEISCKLFSSVNIEIIKFNF